MRRMEGTGPLASVVLCALLTACSTPDGAPASCREHRDCAPAQRCIEGLCRNEPAPCGQALPGCSPGLVSAECLAAGGRPGGQGESACLCPRADEGCPCWALDHCSGICMAGGATCTATTVGTCRHVPGGRPMGCACYLTDSGFQPLCAN